MDFEIDNELFLTAEDHFKENNYLLAEPILNQLVLKGSKNSAVFHMLGTIFYDQGKFNKAIRSFKRALEIDPAFTDSSIGLSIILNDLGRYEEGQKVFDEARAMLNNRSKSSDTQVNERFANKHDELGEMYFQHQKFQEALEQFTKALALTTLRKAEISVSIADCHIHLSSLPHAIRDLRLIVREFPQFVPARLRLGKCYYDSNQAPEAIEQWEAALHYDPNCSAAKDFLRLAQAVQVTNLNSPTMDI
jgi:tetratricopeptide (TPR) repeat protein